MTHNIPLEGEISHSDRQGNLFHENNNNSRIWYRDFSLFLYNQRRKTFFRKLYIVCWHEYYFFPIKVETSNYIFKWHSGNYIF